MFFPSAATGDKLVVTGFTVHDLSARSSSNISSYAISGEQASDFTEYPHTPLRKGGSYMEFMIRVDPNGTYATNGDFQNAETLNSSACSMEIGGNVFPHTSMTIAGGATTTLLRFRFNATSSAVTTYRNLLGIGDAVEIILNW